MIPAFLLMLREGLEAALIVGIIAAYLVKIGRRDALPRVWIGVIAAVVVSVVLGVAVVATVGRLPLVVQETIEGVAALIAVAVLTWMLFWMRRQGRAIKGDLERGVDLAIASSSVWALVGLAFVAVFREGIETVLFMSVLLSANPAGAGPAIGGFLGLALAVAIGWAIFVAGVRIDLRRFFMITGIAADLRRGRACARSRSASSAKPACSRTAARSSTSAGSCPRPARSGPCWPGCSATAPRRRRSS